MALSIDEAKSLPAVQEAGLFASIQRAAADPQTDVAKMQALLEMGLKLEGIKAERAFNEAIRSVQAKLPAIKRTKTNSHTKSTYANLEAINRAIVPIYTAEGLSLSFGTADSPLADHYRVTCRVSHIGGHSANYQHDVPSDAAGAKGTANKNATQAAGSALSYGRRYLTALIFNLTTTDDDDGNQAAGEDTIGDGQTANLTALMEEVKADKPKFLELFQIERLEDLPCAQYLVAVRLLEAKRR